MLVMKEERARHLWLEFRLIDMTATRPLLFHEVRVAIDSETVTITKGKMLISQCFGTLAQSRGVGIRVLCGCLIYHPFPASDY